MGFSVDFHELDDSPQEERTRDGFAATRRIECAWEDRLTLRDELLPLIGLGHLYPHSPLIGARCVGVGSVGMGKQQMQDLGGNGGKIAKYEKAVLTVRYETPRADSARPVDPNSPSEQEAFSEELESTLEFMTLPANDLSWTADGSTPLTQEEAPGMPLHGFVYRYTRHNLTEPPIQLLQLRGAVNEEAIVSRLLGLTFAPETLLMQEGQLSVGNDPTGAPRFAVSFSMAHNANTWNKFPRKGDTSILWSYIYKMGGGGSPFRPFPPVPFKPPLGLN